ncbi:MAG: ABC transporter permease [Chitinophagaceae bacterium]|nr:ABC transporter permease [Chitinophagaceae bacterium]
MKQFGAFVLKEFRHIFRDKRTMMILLGMPVIQIILFGFAITTEVKNANVAICDPSKDIATQKIIERIKANEHFSISTILNNPDQITTLFREGKTGLVICFSERFNENLMHSGHAQIQLIADATDPNTATTLTNYASAIIASYQQELMNQSSVPLRISTETKFLYNPQMKGAYNFVPGVLGMILMLICAMMTSIAIVREKEMGTMEVLLVSPMKPILIILAKVVPYFIISCVNLTTVLLLSVFVLGVPVAGSLFWLIAVSMLFIFVSLALGLLVSTLTESQMAAMLISGMAFMMPVMLLSGMMFPIENMPVPLQWLSNIIPAKWFIISMKNLMIKGTAVSSVIKEIIILCVMALVIITVSLKKFKNRLE